MTDEDTLDEMNETIVVMMAIIFVILLFNLFVG